MPAPTPPDAPVAVPPVPDRTDKSTFVTRSFNFTSWFVPFQAWLVTVLTYITTSNTWVESQAIAAASSATAAAASATEAEGFADDSSDFADLAETNSLAYIGWYSARHQGSHPSAPSVRNDSSALVAGDLYYNATDGNTYIWS
jgi:hypothetical protein